MIKPKRLPVLRQDGTIEIPLTMGYVAIIDWEDVWAAGHTWTALTTPTGHTYAGNGKRTLHREIMGFGTKNGLDVDHIDGDTMNCRRSNLRAVSHLKNVRNRKIHKQNTSGCPGVRLCKNGRWSVTLTTLYLGTYDTFEEAKTVRLMNEEKFWGIEPRREELHNSVDKSVDLTNYSRGRRSDFGTTKVTEHVYNGKLYKYKSRLKKIDE